MPFDFVFAGLCPQGPIYVIPIGGQTHSYEFSGESSRIFKTTHLSCKWPWAWNPISLKLSVFLWKKGILIKTSSSKNPGKLNEISSTLAISRWWLIKYYYEYWNIHILSASYPGLVWFLKKQPLKITYCELENTEADLFDHQNNSMR